MVKLTVWWPHFSLSPPRLAFLAWDDFHARSRFARSTIPEEKRGLYLFTSQLCFYLETDKKFNQVAYCGKLLIHQKNLFEINNFADKDLNTT